MKNLMTNFKKDSIYFGMFLLALSLSSCDDDDIIEGATGTIMAEPQFLSQNTLIVQNVKVDTDAWLVVRKLNGYGNYSGLLSEPILLEEGSTDDLRIELGNRDAEYDGRMQLQNGSTLILMLHQDDGDGIFEYDDISGGADRLITDGTGGAIHETVKISSSRTVINEPTQTVENHTVIIDTVSTNANGWIVLHNSNEDGTIKESEIVGRSFVAAGDNANVEVVLDEDFTYAAGQTLYARLYRDDPADEEFTFEGNPEEDMPFIFGFSEDNTITNSMVIE